MPLHVRGRVLTWAVMAIVDGVFICLLLRILSALMDFSVQVREGSKKPYFMSTFTQYSMLTFNQVIMMKGKHSRDPYGLQKAELSTWRRLL